MLKEQMNAGLVEIYERQVNGLDVFAIKPWEVTLGMKLQFRSSEELEMLNKQDCLYVPFTSKIKKNLVTTFIVDETNLQAIEEHKRSVFALGSNNVCVSLAMLKPYDVTQTQTQPQQPEQLQYKQCSIRSKNHDPQIIKEMISKVDKKRLKQLMSVCASGSRTRNVVDNSIVDTYLELWAEAKYEFYVLFERNLTLDTQVDLPMTTSEMEHLVDELKHKYPKYWPLLNMFEMQSFIENKLTYISNSFERIFGNTYKKGIKLSKCLSQICEDSKFDIDLSIVLQNKYVKGHMTISIDPYDYLTSSINKSGWRSCHRITDGEYATGPVSYLLDDTTLIAYRHNKNNYAYDLFGFKFEGNSKSFRQCIYMDKDTCSIIFGRQYPSSNACLAKVIRDTLEEKVAQTFNVENKWVISKNRHTGQYKDMSKLHYSDVCGGWDYMFARLSCTEPTTPNFKVGSVAPCMKCSNKFVRSSKEKCTCGTC